MVATVLDDAIEDKLRHVSRPTVVFCGTTGGWPRSRASTRSA